MIEWLNDPGHLRGEYSFGGTTLKPEGPNYASVPPSQNKCNIYVANTIFQALGLEFLVHEKEDEHRKFFPYRAAEWADKSNAIPLYISARDKPDAPGIKDGVQQETGIHIKTTELLGNNDSTYRRYCPNCPS